MVTEDSKTIQNRAFLKSESEINVSQIRIMMMMKMVMTIMAMLMVKTMTMMMLMIVSREENRHVSLRDMLSFGWQVKLMIFIRILLNTYLITLLYFTFSTSMEIISDQC